MIKHYKLIVILVGAIVLVSIGIVAAVIIADSNGGRTMTVGTDIDNDDITDFYWTYDSSAYPPEFQRYRFFTDEGGHYFYHETREGDHWPLTEDDITIKGTSELSAEDWSSFLNCLKDGTVTARGKDVTDGDSGPWTFLYWKNDKGKYQVFTFASFDAKQSFEELCKRLEKN